MHRLLALLLLIPTLATAQTRQIYLPDSVVVTASREAEDVRQTGRRVTVLTAADIARLPVASLDELLRTAAGVEVFSRGAFGVQSDLTVRGSTFGGVLVLVDGVRFNDPQTGHFLSDFPVPLSEIARVEVLRGPASALYGPDAVGGVVQVFTFTGMGADSGGRLAASGGSHALVQADGAVRLSQGSTTVGAAGAYGRSDGHRIDNLDATAGPLRSGFARGAATAALRRAVGGGHVFARAAFDARRFDAVRFYTPFPSDTARETTETYWAQVGFQSDATASTRYTLQFGGRVHDDRYTFNARTPANTHTSRQATILGAVHHTLAEGIVGTAGLTGVLRDIDSNNLGEHSDASAGGYVGLRATPLPGLTATWSGRIDHDPGFGTEVTPQAALAFSRGVVTFRAAAGRSVRAPSYTERYSDTRRTRPNNLGHPDLKAERAWTVEAGADAYLPRFSLHATAFVRRIDNLIDFVKLTPADTVFRARNLLAVRTAGLELEADARHDFGPAQGRVTLAYTYLDARIDDLAPEVQTKYALTSARHLGQIMLGLDAGAVSVGVQSMVKEPLAGAAYAVHNVRVAYALPLSGVRLHLTGEVRNVLDTRYTEVFASMPGRWLVVGARVAF